MTFSAPQYSLPLRWIIVLHVLAGSCAQAQVQPASPAQEPTQLRVSTGMRLWSAKWDSWYINAHSDVGGTRYNVVEALNAGTQLASIPFVSLRYGQLFASASTLLRRSYSFDATVPNTFTGSNSRSEFDVNVGYTFSSGITLSLGNKQIRQSLVQGSTQVQAKANGPVLGINASAPLSSGWGVYSAFGKGWLTYKLPQEAADVNQQTSFSTDYQLLEAGLSYAFYAQGRWIRSLVFSTGYRTQRMATKGFGLAQTPPGGQAQPNRTAELIDVTQGLVLGLQGTF